MENTYTNLCNNRALHPSLYSVETVKAIQYVEDLANLSRVNLETWNFDLFAELTCPNGERLAIKLDKDALNQRFFDEMERRSKDPSVPKDVAKQLSAGHIENFQKQWIEQEKRRMAEAASYHRDRAVNLLAQFQTETRSSIQMFMKSEALAGRSLDITGRVNKVLKLGPWKYLKWENNCVVFQASSDIWQTYRNAATEEHYRVNFGKLHAWLNAQEGKLRVFRDPAKCVIFNSPYHGQCFHPHVNAEGTVCWGDGASDAARGLAEGNYERVFQVLFAILTHYNPESPYVTLKDFQTLQPENKPGFVPKLCPKCNGNEDMGMCQCCDLCEEKPEDCSCYYCLVCDNKTTKSDGKSCPCCEICKNYEGECVCCRICGEQTMEEGDYTCTCCTYCEQKSCECEPCPADGCEKKKRKCFDLCIQCKSNHVDEKRGHWCPLCNAKEILENYGSQEEEQAASTNTPVAGLSTAMGESYEFTEEESSGE